MYNIIINIVINVHLVFVPGSRTVIGRIHTSAFQILISILQ